MEIVLIRHGETAWSRDGRHTGRTDVPLTEAGRAQAAAVGPRLAGRAFARVLCSPLVRARETADLAGLGSRAEHRDALLEWDYGAYEGRTTADIREERPDWFLWRDGCPHGEAAGDVGARADAVLAEARAVDADVALVAHGHVLRVLGARWLGLAPGDGRLLHLATAAISVLGFERETPVLQRWNDTAHLDVHV
jgi:probable phosphoglycerate mutase